MSDAIETARIAAHAEILAAWIQGGLAFAAGFFVILGGGLAYLGAREAARIQVRLEEDKYKALVCAYKSRMVGVATKLDNMAFINDVHVKCNENEIMIERFDLPEELDPKNWRDHAMLGDEAVTAISDAHEIVRIFGEFTREMRGKSADTNSETFGAERAIDAYRELNQELRDRASKLHTTLKPKPQAKRV